MFFLVLVKHGVLAFDARNEVAAVVRVPIPHGRYGVLIPVKDDLSYVTVYNDCGDVFMLDMYRAMDMIVVCAYILDTRSLGKYWRKIPLLTMVLCCATYYHV